MPDTHVSAARPGAAELREIARKALPAGGFGNVNYDIIIERGLAGHVWDVEGREYIDYLLGSGPMIVGHANPEVTEVALEKVAKGSTFFANNADGILLAAEIVDAVACAEQVRFVSSGSEADAYAMRLARAHTGRDKILKFEGGYHGMSDYGLISLAPTTFSNFPQGVPDSAGIPASVQAEMLVAPYNDLETVEALVKEHKHEIAAIMAEPFQRLIPPKPGFLEGLRRITQENGLLLIFDEVVTGFRFAYGGAQAYYGVVPDICTLGKAIGGGYPLAAIAGRADIMAHFDKKAVAADKFMTQVGTLSGNPVAAAAGLKTLEILKRPGAYEHIFKIGRAIMDGYTEILAKTDLKAKVVGDAPMFDVIFTEKDVIDYRSSKSDPALTTRWNQLMRERGILKSEGKHYISWAHTEADVTATLAAFGDSIDQLVRERAA
ncbi:MAG: aminotransferase class III-fold pyridoxal phosphate-dependent enzyme [Alphaproteobacteria bacterium]|nr:aminotransferase class III-fold pyridoxal phosphate-dependent enzyme [Alphaproteobacteria bacterium]MCB9931470.1 aminotransferase class III-fold pyridoxal phosphate-dependent enzyme [Alphaproteobacteria bacterium]